MSSVDTRPQIVDVDAYAGDTLTIHVKVDSAFVAGRTWTAQARSRRDSNKVDATLNVIPSATGADVVLMSADSRRLTARGDYNGFWDVQLSAPDGADPVTTLATGELRLHLDVTRVPT